MSTSLWLLLLAYLGLLLWALRQKQHRFDGPWWFHLRAFLPNWKFYHAIGWMPRLMVRHRVNPDSPPANWQQVYPRHPRHWTHLFHNPGVNLSLTLQNLVDHLANDIANLPDGKAVDELPVYTLVQRYAAQHLLTQGVTADEQVQMQLHLIHPLRQQTEVVLNAPWLTLRDIAASGDVK